MKGKLGYKREGRRVKRKQSKKEIKTGIKRIESE